MVIDILLFIALFIAFYQFISNIKDTDTEPKVWNEQNPTKKEAYICRMDNCYIKLCYWDGTTWLDMYKPTLEGKVVKWMKIPNE